MINPHFHFGKNFESEHRLCFRGIDRTPNSEANNNQNEWNLSPQQRAKERMDRDRTSSEVNGYCVDKKGIVHNCEQQVKKAKKEIIHQPYTPESRDPYPVGFVRTRFSKEAKSAPPYSGMYMEQKQADGSWGRVPWDAALIEKYRKADNYLDKARVVIKDKVPPPYQHEAFVRVQTDMLQKMEDPQFAADREAEVDVRDEELRAEERRYQAREKRAKANRIRLGLESSGVSGKPQDKNSPEYQQYLKNRYKYSEDVRKNGPLGAKRIWTNEKINRERQAEELPDEEFSEDWMKRTYEAAGETAAYENMKFDNAERAGKRLERDAPLDGKLLLNDIKKMMNIPDGVEFKLNREGRIQVFKNKMHVYDVFPTHSYGENIRKYGVVKVDARRRADDYAEFLTTKEAIAHLEDVVRNKTAPNPMIIREVSAEQTQAPPSSAFEPRSPRDVYGPNNPPPPPEPTVAKQPRSVLKNKLPEGVVPSGLQAKEIAKSLGGNYEVRNGLNFNGFEVKNIQTGKITTFNVNFSKDGQSFVTHINGAGALLHAAVTPDDIKRLVHQMEGKENIEDPTRERSIASLKEGESMFLADGVKIRNEKGLKIKFDSTKWEIGNITPVSVDLSLDFALGQKVVNSVSNSTSLVMNFENGNSLSKQKDASTFEIKSNNYHYILTKKGSVLSKPKIASVADKFDTQGWKQFENLTFETAKDHLSKLKKVEANLKDLLKYDAGDKTIKIELEAILKNIHALNDERLNRATVQDLARMETPDVEELLATIYAMKDVVYKFEDVYEKNQAEKMQSIVQLPEDLSFNFYDDMFWLDLRGDWGVEFAKEISTITLGTSLEKQSTDKDGSKVYEFTNQERADFLKSGIVRGKFQPQPTRLIVKKDGTLRIITPDGNELKVRKKTEQEKKNEEYFSKEDEKMRYPEKIEPLLKNKAPNIDWQLKPRTSKDRHDTYSAKVNGTLYEQFTFESGEVTTAVYPELWAEIEHKPGTIEDKMIAHVKAAIEEDKKKTEHQNMPQEELPTEENQPVEKGPEKQLQKISEKIQSLKPGEKISIAEGITAQLPKGSDEYSIVLDSKIWGVAGNAEFKMGTEPKAGGSIGDNEVISFKRNSFYFDPNGRVQVEVNSEKTTIFKKEIVDRANATKQPQIVEINSTTKKPFTLEQLANNLTGHEVDELEGVKIESVEFKAENGKLNVIFKGTLKNKNQDKILQTEMESMIQAYTKDGDIVWPEGLTPTVVIEMK